MQSYKPYFVQYRGCRKWGVLECTSPPKLIAEYDRASEAVEAARQLNKEEPHGSQKKQIRPPART